MLLDEILDERYEVYLDEADYIWNEYDDYTNNKPKLLKTFKTEGEAKEYLAICEEHKAQVQKKYRGRIRYYITPMYLRHDVTAVWAYSNKPQAELDEFFERLVGRPKSPAPYTG